MAYFELGASVVAIDITLLLAAPGTEVPQVGRKAWLLVAASPRAKSPNFRLVAGPDILKQT